MTIEVLQPVAPLLLLDLAVYVQLGLVLALRSLPMRALLLASVLAFLGLRRAQHGTDSTVTESLLVLSAALCLALVAVRARRPRRHVTDLPACPEHAAPASTTSAGGTTVRGGLDAMTAHEVRSISAGLAGAATLLVDPALQGGPRERICQLIAAEAQRLQRRLGSPGVAPGAPAWTAAVVAQPCCSGQQGQAEPAASDAAGNPASDAPVPRMPVVHEPPPRGTFVGPTTTHAPRPQPVRAYTRAPECDVDTIVASLALSHRARGRRVSAGTTGLRVAAPHDDLAEILGVLLDNVAEHAPGSRTEVRGTRVGALAVLRVSDDGPGIDPRLCATMFQPGVQRQGSRGSGLGLTSARALARRHGGDLRLVRGSVGCTWEVVLPVAGSVSSISGTPAQRVKAAGAGVDRRSAQRGVVA
ncbi:sensor histidine kinase [Nocardioides bruguierae]|uniref:sensor histidine kinase n=1 Tax=Nocardioides bruguierae TaxID=2945102 RepID=UPI002020FCBB|nr:ATP-binding protein [Nocardioides bruguierae]MCL8027248.1 ATP-binding protein [Nocardioides bruguierae]